MRMRHFGIASLVLLSSVCLTSAEEPDPFPETFKDFRKSEKSILAPRSGGGVVVLDRENDAFAWWDARGEIEGACSLKTIGFSALRADAMAEFQGTVFVATIDLSRDQGSGFRGYIIDLPECKVERTVNLPGPVMQVARTLDHWVVRMLPASFEDSEGRWPGCDVSLIDDEGRLEGQLPPPKGLLERWDEAGIHHGMMAGCTFGRLALARKTHWIIPVERYEFWRPRQRGLSEFLLSVPVCLESEKKVFTGEEAQDEAQLRFKGASVDVQEQLEESLNKGSFHVQLPAISAAASMGDLLAVTVRVHDETGRRCRLDVWDMGLEDIVFTTFLDAMECNRFGFLALGNDVVWVLDETK
ncbi:MAG: hypothetical protein K8R59_08770, partial [Thermoanaerobaculales bacterium]|nr:hypothetical protein [Thermoanaerobaculales bacterium]